MLSRLFIGKINKLIRYSYEGLGVEICYLDISAALVAPVGITLSLRSLWILTY